MIEYELAHKILIDLSASSFSVPTSISSFFVTFTFIFTAITFDLMAIDRISKKPRIKVVFFDENREESAVFYKLMNKLKISKHPSKKKIYGTKEVKYGCQEKTTITLYFINEGDLFKIKKLSAHLIAASFYLNNDFTIHQIRRAEKVNNDVHKSSTFGIFNDMIYVEVPTVYPYIPPAISILSYGEAEKIDIDITTPEKAGIYYLFVPIDTREGDLGVKKLKICISDK